MREGWICPACQRVLNPDLPVCPCSEGGAAAPAAPLAPVTPMPTATGAPLPQSPYTVTLTPPAATTVWTTGGISSIAGTAWDGVQVTAMNRSNLAA